MRSPARVLTPLILLLPLLLHTATASAAPKQLAGFPAHAGGKNTTSSILATDLDGDGVPEIVVTADGALTVVQADGTTRPGFPFALKTEGERIKMTFGGGPTACDITGDGKKELLIAGANGKVFAVTASGSTVPGFPAKIAGRSRAVVSCVRRKGGVEIYLTTDTGALQRIDGRGAVSTVANLGRGTESGVALGDIDLDGKFELIVAGGDSKLHVLDSRGRERKGFPYKTDFRSSGTPALGDIDDDGKLDIVFGSQDFKVHAVDAKGRSLAGFPVATGYRIYAGVSLVDLDGDDVPDVVAGSGDGKIYAFSGKGKALKGFPVRADGRVTADVVAADIDQDGRPELAAVTEAGTLMLLDARGKAVPDFPFRLGGKVTIAPAFADLNGDGVPDLIAQTTRGKLHVFPGRTTPRSGRAAKAAIAHWPLAGHDPGHTGRKQPHHGRFRTATFKQKTPRTTDNLDVLYDFVDLDGDAEKGTKIHWYVDGKLRASLDDKKQVPAQETRKHQVWHYTLQNSHNAKTYGHDGVLTRIVESEHIKILNTVPTAPAITLKPERVTTTDLMEAIVSTPSKDVDGDAIIYRHIWIQNGKALKVKPSTTKIAAKRTRKHDTWKLLVVPFDGEEEGPGSSALRTVHNTPPTAPTLAHGPTEVGANTQVKLRIAKKSTDADKDAVTYTYRYWVNEKPLWLASSVATIEPQVLRKHDKVRVEVTAHDDEVPGGRSQVEFKVLNSKPASPKITIRPTQPTTTSPLSVGFTQQSADFDHDPVTYRHVWKRDAEIVEFPTEVPAEATKRGQTWSVSVTPFDAEQEGEAVTFSTVIANAKPKAPLMALEKHRWSTDESIEPQVVVPAKDADADAVRLIYHWTRDGARQRFAADKSKLLNTETRKGQKWQVSVTPNDGTVDGQATLLAFTIINSPPTAPVLSISSTEATTRQTVSVGIGSASTDKDGDELRYRFSWYRDGKRVGAWPTKKNSLKPGDAKKGEHWRVEARAYDGQVEGPPGTIALRILNHAPDAPKAKISPKKPTTSDDLRCTPAVATVDADRDTLIHRSRWYLNGKLVPRDSSSASLPASSTLEKQSWTCELQAWDGELASTWVRSASVTVINSVPSVPVVTLGPKNASTADNLSCGLSTPSVDLDGERVSYRYTWRVKGKPFRKKLESPNLIPSKHTKKGQAWSCMVTASDGDSETKSKSIALTIRNSAPTLPKILIEPSKPTVKDELSCKLVERARDADSDKLRYSFTWFKDGVRQNFAPTSTEVPARLTKIRDMWKCEVRVSDGSEEGPVAQSGDVIVGR